MQAPPLLSWQYSAPEVIVQNVDVLGGGGGGDDTLALVAQTVHPASSPEPSDDQDAVVTPGVMGTAVGPVVPLYWEPPMVSVSQHSSVAKLVAVSVRGCTAVKVQASLSP